MSQCPHLRGDWFVLADAATTQLPDVILYTVAATTATVDVLTYRRHGEGFRPDRESSRHRQTRLRRITVTDGDGELASAGDHDTPSGKTLRSTKSKDFNTKSRFLPRPRFGSSCKKSQLHQRHRIII